MRQFAYWLALGLLLGCLNARAQTAPRLRVLTYNIHHGEGTDGKFDYDRLARTILNLKPDVVALQEVDRRTQRAKGLDQAAKLGELTGMRHAFGKAFHYSSGEYGETILSRFPIESEKTHPLPYRFGQEPRAALEVTVKPGNGLPDLVLVDTHLCHQSESNRMDQVRQINRILPRAGGPPMILAGDFNARPGSESIRELKGDRWRDAIAPQSVIDYIFVRSGDPWRVVEVTIVDDLVVSDHRPVLAVLEWQGGQH